MVINPAVKAGLVVNTLVVVMLLADRSQAHDGHTHAPSRPSGGASVDSAERFGGGFERQSITGRAPHGGRISKTFLHYIEVVYFPHETRIYLYGTAQNPLSANGVSGEVLMQVRGNPQVFRYPVQYVPKDSNTDQDYLVVKVDVTRVRDQDMEVTIELKNLPQRQESDARIIQTFALSLTPLPVKILPLSDTDRVAVAAQRTCPVTASGFDHGPPIKLEVADRVLYVCCDGCVDAVKDNPRLYWDKLRAGGIEQAPPKTQVLVQRATEQDESSVRAQRVCPSTGELLGSHGPPLSVSVGNQRVFVCCEACVHDVTADPAKYVAHAGKLREVFAGR